MRATKINFAPLTKNETELCVRFLSANADSLRKMVKKLLLVLSKSRHFEPTTKRLSISQMYRSARKSQRFWRGVLIGPPTISEKLAKECRPSEEQSPSFDAFLCKTTEVNLPSFEFGATWQSASERHKKWQPGIVWRLRTPGDYFDTLFFRAILNLQASGFVCCAVCGKWEKRLSGRRGFLADRNKNLIGKLPAWPGLCGSRKCKIAFDHVVSGESPGLLSDFAIRKV